MEAIKLDRISKLKHLPSLPHILVKLFQICSRESAELHDIAALIEKDPSLSVKLIRLVNCAQYGVVQRIASVSQAVSLVGLAGVKNIVICACVHEVFRPHAQQPHFDICQFWGHSLRCAVMARQLADKGGSPQPEDAFLAGLLHDIGKLVLWINFPQQSKQLARTAEHGSVVTEKETTLFGTTHPQVAAWLLRQWQFPSLVTDAILYHHDDPVRVATAFPLVRQVYAANLLCQSEGLETEIVKRLTGLDDKALAAIRQNAESEVADLARSLGIDIASSAADEDQSCRQLLTENVREHSLLIGTLQSLLAAGNQKAILKIVNDGLQILFGIERSLVFLVDSAAKALVGLEGSRRRDKGRAVDMAIPMVTAASRVVACFNHQEITDTFGHEPAKPPVIVDAQPVRYLGRSGMICVPMRHQGTPTGVLVFGMEEPGRQQLTPHHSLLELFADQAAAALRFHQLRKKIFARIRSERLDASTAVTRRVFHEVNNPLGIIKNYLKILDHKLAINDLVEVQDELKVIGEEITRISTMLKELADYSAPKVHKRDQVDVNRVLTDIGKILKESLFNQSKLRLHLDLAPALPRIRSDVDSLKQVFLNLIKNGAEAMSKGGNLTLSTRQLSHPTRGKRDLFGRPANAIQVSFEDDGPGIALEVLPRIFEPFVSTKDSAQSGLGLAVVHNIVTALGGEIRCDSRPGKGTRFDIILPVNG